MLIKSFLSVVCCVTTSCFTLTLYKPVALLVHIQMHSVKSKKKIILLKLKNLLKPDEAEEVRMITLFNALLTLLVCIA